MENRESPGSRVLAAVTEVVRWAGRTGVRGRLLGAAGRELSVNDVHLLRVIVANGPVRVSDLAESQGVDKSTITPQVRRLEERDLVTRRPDPADRRAVLLSVTARGHRIRRQMNKAGAAVFDDVLRDWPDDDRRALAEELRWAHSAARCGRDPAGGTDSNPARRLRDKDSATRSAPRPRHCGGEQAHAVGPKVQPDRGEQAAAALSKPA